MKKKKNQKLPKRKADKLNSNILGKLPDVAEDPMLKRKKGQKTVFNKEEIQKKIESQKYMDFVINKIASELCHGIYR